MINNSILTHNTVVIYFLIYGFVYIITSIEIFLHCTNIETIVKQ